MTSRFIQLSYETTDFSDVLEYLHYPVLSLEQALRPVLNRLDALDDRIKRAKKYCCHSPPSDLTRDECGALDLYAEDRGEQSLHYALNKAIRSRHRSEVKLWFGYLKLLQVALEKIPNLSITVWCGMSCHLANNLRENQEIVWWNVISCTSSYDAINGLRHDYSVLCSIESLTGKNVYRYTGRINQSEVLFLPGTRLRVKSKVHNRVLHEPAIHLVEIVNDTPARPMPMVASSSSSKKSSASGSFEQQSTSSKKTESESSSWSKHKDPTGSAVSSVTTFANGDRYDVVYSDNQKEGFATLSHAHGEEYRGVFATIRANGSGNRTWENGDHYAGDFEKGKMHGQGMLSRSDGYVYQGEWFRGEPFGKGTSRWGNGHLYEGSHWRGKITGFGNFHSDNDDSYIGNLVDGKANGKGSRGWPDGDSYNGDFKDDKKHGYGTYTYACGGEYSGDWADDQMNGYGTMQWSSGSRYKGAYRDGKRHGQGKFTSANGRIKEGRWVNDTFVG